VQIQPVSEKPAKPEKPKARMEVVSNTVDDEVQNEQKKSHYWPLLGTIYTQEKSCYRHYMYTAEISLLALYICPNMELVSDTVNDEVRRMCNTMKYNSNGIT